MSTHFVRTGRILVLSIFMAFMGQLTSFPAGAVQLEQPDVPVPEPPQPVLRFQPPEKAESLGDFVPAGVIPYDMTPALRQEWHPKRRLSWCG